MAATITSVTLPNTRWAAPKPEVQRLHALATVNFPLRMSARRLALHVRATPPQQQNISDAVQESIKHAQEACAGDPASGECVAAWDEVEELSAAASDARQKQKEIDADPLEAFCKDNPSTEECRTYED
ncbi:calvin cycle protein CP12-2, chloroplastic [Nymphaea colorata]|uniref:CP12 domain-containing protein n=1 Tax=Nymphaea colorata TaxID=210225 RepID=A0A5K0XBC0_9MAGN|nr:calvin cycle protein CP12-2, chloroplastic [Nymphaea colorata]